MKKTLIIIAALVVIMAVAVPVALAMTEPQKTELTALHQQMYELRLQILDKQVEAGLVKAEDAAAIRERMEQSWATKLERMAEGDFAFGQGRGGGSMMRGLLGGGNGCGNGQRRTGR